MLKRDVQVVGYLRVGADCGSQRFGYPRWMRIQNSNPVQAVSLAQPLEQNRQLIRASAIRPKRSGIVRDQHYLLCAVVNERAHFGRHGLDSSAAKPASERRYQAIAAPVIAPVGDLHVSVVRRGQLEPGRVGLGQAGRLANPDEFLPFAHRVERLNDPQILARAEKRVYLGHLGRERCRAALRQAAGHDNMPARAPLLQS